MGNPTIDIDDRGRRGFGGSCVYATIQAARLGLRATCHGRATTADAARLADLLPEGTTSALGDGPFTTTFENVFDGEDRRQRVLARGGSVPLPAPTADIVLWCPILDEVELPGATTGFDSGTFRSCTPQGAMRHVDADGHVELHPLDAASPWWSGLDLLVVNEDEAPYAAAVIEQVVTAGGAAVVTLGAAGARVLDGRTEHPIPAFPVDRIVDRNGAGDVFATVMTVALAEGADLDRAATLASAAAALSLRAVGFGGIPDRAELETAAGT